MPFAVSHYDNYDDVISGCGLQALGPYSTSKTALLGLTKALAAELAPAIRVNCIAPGIIKTKFSSAVRLLALPTFSSLSSLFRFGRMK